MKKREGEELKVLRTSKILYDMEEAAREIMEREHPSIDELLDKNIALMVNRLELKVLRPVDEDEEAVYNSWACPSERATLLRCYDMKVGEDRTAVCGSAWSIVNIKSRKIMKVKDIDTRKYSKDKYIDPLDGRRVRVTQGDEAGMADLATVTVGRNDLDDYGHMNNVKYLEHIEENLPILMDGQHYISEASLHFVRECMIDWELKLRHLSRDGRELIAFYGPDGPEVFECELLISEI